MEDSLGKLQKGGKHFGGMTYTRQVPSFIARMNAGSSNDEGIKGALARRQAARCTSREGGLRAAHMWEQELFV